MQVSYQECYAKFYQSYGPYKNWPAPYAYLNWFSTLPENYQPFYLHPTNYCYLYEWTNEFLKNQERKTSKPSRAQKRKLKKKQLQEEYDKEKAVIGKWVQKERKDLITQLQKIQQQEQKAKQKRQKKLSYLIEIHKEVFKHHQKKKSAAETNHKRVENQNRKKRLSVIKKMKQIFESRKEKTLGEIKSNGEKEQKQAASRQSNQCSQEQKSQTNIKIQIVEEDEFEDMTDEQQLSQQKDVIKPAVTVSFPIKQIEYKDIGKLTGKVYNDIVLREWVSNLPNSELEQICLKLINRLAYKQAIKKVKNPQKAKKIIVSGLKESKRTLTTILQNKRAKILIVALNIERNNLIKGVDDEIQKCISLGQEMKIPVIHVSTRSKLGRAFTGKFGPRLSIISIINYEGYQDYVEELLKSWQKSCEDYQKLT